MTFSSTVHQQAADLWQQSFNHPFITEMANGQLPIRKFRFYCIQDYRYLEVFNRLQRHVMDNLSVNYSIPNNLFSMDDSQLEIKEREKYFDEMKVSAQEYHNTALAPTNYDYLNHLRRSVAVSPEVGLAALLPCPWLYSELAEHWQGQHSPQPMYDHFFETYAEVAASGEKQRMIAALNTVAGAVDQVIQQEMQRAFMRSSFYELHFWQMAMEEEGWQNWSNLIGP